MRVVCTFLLTAVFAFAVNAQSDWKTLKKTDNKDELSELLVFHCECTGSLEVDIDTGHLKLPDSLVGKVHTTFNLAGDQWKEIFGSYKDNRAEYMYLVRGKLIGASVPATPGQQKAGLSYVPVFDVYEYKLARKFTQLQPSLLKWTNVDAEYGPLPASVHVYFANSQMDTGAFRAYYLIADLHDKDLQFMADTSRDRRLTPAQFFQRNHSPLAVVNTTFFSYETNRSLNAVIMNGKLVAYNQHTINGRGKDTFTYRHPFGSAIGISKNRRANIAWLYTDSSFKNAFAVEKVVPVFKDSSIKLSVRTAFKHFFPSELATYRGAIKHSKWKMETAVGGGPVLVQDGEIAISNNEELKFAGKAINDKHPRTAMGYTKDGKLIILVVEGRNKNASGATLIQEAEILRDLGCVEAINLDGGGSSCLLVNGKETIHVSDAVGQRPVPAVFMIKDLSSKKDH